MAGTYAIDAFTPFDVGWRAFQFFPDAVYNWHAHSVQPGFIERNNVVPCLDPPGTGKSHLIPALGVQAVKAGKSVYFSTLADLITFNVNRLGFAGRPFGLSYAAMAVSSSMA